MSPRKGNAIRWLLFSTFVLLCLSALTISGVRHAGAVGKAVPVTSAPVQSALPSGVLQGGSWSSIIQTADVPVHMSLLPDGRLLYWGRDKASDGWDVQFQCRTYLWNPLYSYDPTTGDATAYEPNATVEKDNTTTNLFCSGHSFLPDGTLLAAGGHQRHPDPSKAYLEGIGEDDLNTFDYRTTAWTLLPTHMQWGRWYPRTLSLQDGRTLILSGTYLPNPVSGAFLNTTPEIFGLDGSLIQGAQDTNQPQSYINSTYPFISLAPDARLYYAGAPDDTSARFFNLSTNTWARTFADMDAHDTGTAVTYTQGKMIVVGGRHFAIVGRESNGAPIYRWVASNRVQLMNLNLASGNSTPAWIDAQAMQNSRIQATNSVLLPDGKVLVVGGTKCPGTNAIKYNLNGEDPALPPCDNGQVLTPELWTPGDAINPSGSWSQMAPHQETRVYHSTALLLPDGRVLVAGGGLPAASGETASGVLCMGSNENLFTCKHYGHKTAEIFSPPYLFESDGAGAAKPAVRPAITSVPASVAYGQQFSIGVGNVSPTTTDIAKVVLVSLPSITHGTDPNQRRVELSFQSSGDNLNLTVTAPANGTVCPPGPYMLFLIRNNGRGTPSFAKVIRIGDISVNKSFQNFNSGVRSGDSQNGSVFGSVNVIASPGVNWTASLNADAASWLTITSSQNGSGSATINLSASVNTTGSVRSGTLFINVPGRSYYGFRVQVSQAAEFSDVPVEDQFYPFIQKIYAQKVTLGYGGGIYGLTDPVVRGQMATFIGRSLGLTNLPAPQNASFADVPSSHMFYTWIEAFRRLGLTNGCYYDGVTRKFCPEDSVTRGQMAAFIIKSLGVTDPPKPTKQTFADVPPTNLFYPFIEELARRGLTNGCYNDGVTRNFCPDDPVSRGQMAAFLSKAFGF